MTDGNKNKGMWDQSGDQSDAGDFSNNPQSVSESGEKGGQATQEDQNSQSQDTDMENESYTGDR